MSDKQHNNEVIIQKASGKTEAFDVRKLKTSLKNAGANEDAISEVVSDIQNWVYDGVTTAKIYTRAFRIFRQISTAGALLYNLKKAILDMGPTGYPFEHFVGKLLQTKGYDVEVGVFVQGKCVQHEIDVVATKAGKTIMVECKYHNDRGKLSNVHVPLYINSRFKDVFEVWAKQAEHKHTIFEGWVVTNTRFSSDATDYGLCAGLKLLGWDFPKNAGLKEMVEQSGFFPITVITVAI